MYGLSYHYGKWGFCLEITLVLMDALQQRPLSRWFVSADKPAHCSRLCASLILTRPLEAWQNEGCAAGKAPAMAQHQG